MVSNPVFDSIYNWLHSDKCIYTRLLPLCNSLPCQWCSPLFPTVDSNCVHMHKGFAGNNACTYWMKFRGQQPPMPLKPIFARARIKITVLAWGYCTALVVRVLESRGQPHLKHPLCTNNSPKLPLAMQIQSVSVDCLKERKKLEVLTRTQFSLHPFFAPLSFSLSPSPPRPLSPCIAHRVHRECLRACLPSL